MKIFNWMQSKLNGAHRSNKPDSKSIHKNKVVGPGIEEFNDWPHGLLAIGTFGINNVNGDLQRSNFQGKTESSSEEHLEGLTSEEVLGELQELNSLILLHEQINEQAAPAPELEQKDPKNNLLPLEEFANIQSSLEAHEATTNNDNSDKSTGRNGGHKHSNIVVPSKGKNICLDNTKNSIGKKSLSFLLKKMFLCGSGFSPASSLRDPIPESRMEKILRAILKKKVYSQSTSPSLATKKYLDNRNIPKSTNEDEIFEKTDDGSKWVKTDSEYIVLEI